MLSKICTKCHRNIPLDNFYKQSAMKDGLRYECKDCTKEWQLAYQQTTTYKENKRKAGYKYRHTENGKAKRKLIRQRYLQTENGKNKNHQHHKRWRESEHGREVKRLAAHDWYYTEKGQACNLKHKQSPKHKETYTNYNQSEEVKVKAKLYWQSPAGKAAKERIRAKLRLIKGERLNNAMRAEIRTSLNGTKNGRRWQVLVGYTLQDLIKHLEKQFQPGMTWDNYGQWHLDHIIPLAAFHYSEPSDIDFKRCWALENLQPLWAQDNMQKKDKIIKPFQPSLDLLLKK